MSPVYSVKRLSRSQNVVDSIRGHNLSFAIVYIRAKLLVQEFPLPF